MCVYVKCVNVKLSGVDKSAYVLSDPSQDKSRLKSYFTALTTQHVATIVMAAAQ